MVKYDLVNPCILGQFTTTYESGTPLEAASQFWNDLSTHITNNVPEMYITLQSGGSLHHFKIREKISEGSKMANYTIKEISINLGSKDKKQFLSQVEKVKANRMAQIQQQIGGKDKEKRERYKGKESSSSSNSSSSESDSDSDNDDEYFNFSRYKRMSQPIVYWHYTPFIYRVTRFFTPTFNIPLTPYIHVWNPWI
jgi:hypothetical protein